MISFSPVFVKLANVGPSAAGFYRMLIGGILLCILAGIQGKLRPSAGKPLLLLFACAVFFALDLTFWHRSIRAVGPGLATLLSNFQAFFLAAYGIVALKERPGWKIKVAIPLAMIGLAMIVGPGWHQLTGEYKLGILFGIITAVCYSAYLIALRTVQTETTFSGAMANLALISILSSAVLGAETWIQGETFRIPDAPSGLSLMGYGVVSQVLGWVLIARGMRALGAGQVGLILLLQPTLSFLWDVLFFHRPTDLVEAMGATLVLTAIYLGTARQESG